MVSTLIRLGLVKEASHLMLVQSLKLVMKLAQHFILEERMVKSVTGEIVLDLRLNNIEQVFHLPRADQFIRLTYKVAERWYREHLNEATKIIQSLYLIEKTLLGKVTKKIDMTRGYMKEDIR